MRPGNQKCYHAHMKEELPGTAKYCELTLTQVLVALETMPMGNLFTTERITHHAGIALMEGGWTGTLASETLCPNTGQGYPEISYLVFEGAHYNAKGETREAILDGRYPLLKDATTRDGIGTIVGYNPTHLDSALLASITLRLDSLIASLELQTDTHAAAPSGNKPRRV
jgi:hypothetical protein